MLQTMKQRYKNNNRDDFSITCSSSYKGEEVKVKEEEEDGDELREVAEILLELHHLITKYDTSPPLVSWGVKRKRSALVVDWNPPSSPPLSLNPIPPLIIPSSAAAAAAAMSSIIHQHPPPVSSSVVFVDKREEEEQQQQPNPTTMTKKKKKKKIETSSRRSSPATPLSFSPSESDSIRKPYKRKLSTNKKKTKEEWQTDVIMLADQQDTLKKELRKVMDYYENLKTNNLELKLTLQKVKNHFYQKELLLSANLKSSSSSYNDGKAGGLHLCLEQPSPVPVPPPEQVIQKAVPMVVVYQQQNKIIEQQQQHKSTELLENSRYSYNDNLQLMPPPPPPAASHLQFGVGSGYRGEMEQNANPRGLPDLNFTDASSTLVAEADDTTTTTTTNNSSGFEHLNPNPNYNYIQQQQQQQQHWFELESCSLNNNNRAAAEARRRRMEEMRKGKRSMDSIKTRCR